SGPGAVAQTAAAAACSSRFRVIKLDHGSGEPYRRGRWTCMEYYDRDSEGAAALGRTADCIRHSSTFEQAAQDRDSGLGATGGSVVVSAVPASAHGPDSIADSSLAAVSQLLQTEKMAQPSVQQPGFVLGQQQQPQQPVGGAVPPSAAQPVFSGGPGAAQQPVVPQQPQVAPQAGPNGQGLAPPSATAGQPSVPVGQQPGQQPSIPVTQPQPFAYSQSQMPAVHLLPPGQPEFVQHVALMQPPGALQAAAGSGPGPAASSLPVGQGTGPGPSAGAAPGLGVPAQPEAVGQGPGLLQGGQSQGQPGLGQHKPVTQQPLGGSGPGSAAPPAAQGAPGAAPAAVPTVPGSLGQPPLGSRSSGLGQPQHGAHAAMAGTASSLGQFQPQPQRDETRRKSEPLPQPPPPVGAESKPPGKPPLPDTLANPLQLPASTPMNSLASSVFGISIPVDGDEDSASGASVVAIDNKIEQAMDLVKSHLMYAVREEVEVLKEQIKELVERNSLLERENALLKSLSSSEQLAQLPGQQ
ncbi:T22D2 protein, partial [Serilophus lunatus]|nr:T22D2 protein [Serilophus lunatus]